MATSGASGDGRIWHDRRARRRRAEGEGRRRLGGHALEPPVETRRVNLPARASARTGEGPASRIRAVTSARRARGDDDLAVVALGKIMCVCRLCEMRAVSQRGLARPSYIRPNVPFAIPVVCARRARRGAQPRPSEAGGGAAGGATDRHLMPPRRRGSLSSLHEGRSSPHKKNGGRQSNGRLAPRLVVCVVYLILNEKRQVVQSAMSRHAARRARRADLAAGWSGAMDFCPCSCLRARRWRRRERRGRRLCGALRSPTRARCCFVSQAGEEQSLRKIDETLNANIKFLTVLQFFLVVYENQHSKNTTKKAPVFGSGK